LGPVVRRNRDARDPDHPGWLRRRCYERKAYPMKRCPDCGAVAAALDPIMHGPQCGWDDEIRTDRESDIYLGSPR
jgi:hypothetical protein